MTKLKKKGGIQNDPGGLSGVIDGRLDERTTSAKYEQIERRRGGSSAINRAINGKRESSAKEEKS